MPQVKIDLRLLKKEDWINAMIAQELQNAARCLTNALVLIEMAPKSSPTEKLFSSKGLQARHKLQIMRAQIVDLTENSIKFREIISNALSKEFKKVLAKKKQEAA